MKQLILISALTLITLTTSAQDKGQPSNSKAIIKQVKTTIAKLHKVDKKLIQSISKDKTEFSNRMSKFKGMISKSVMAKLNKGDYDKTIMEQFAKQKKKKTILFRFQLMAYGVHDLQLTFVKTKKGEETVLTLKKLEQFGW